MTVLALALLLAIPQAVELTAGQKRDRGRAKFETHHAGEIPTQWGVLHSVAVTGSNNYHFVFRDKEETLRIVKFSGGGKIPGQVTEVTRKY